MSSNESVTSVRTSAEGSSSLRWWPAALILLCMAAIKFIPSWMSDPGIEVLMLGFMGPAAVGLLIVAWWMFASRAGWREKIIGLCGLLLIAVVSIGFTHVSLQGMASVLFQVPLGVAVFGLSLVVFARAPGTRVPVALLATAVAFGFWTLLRMDGATGRFDLDLAWRWTATAEEKYVEMLTDGNSSSNVGDSPASEISITAEQAEWPEFRGRGRVGIVEGISIQEDWMVHPPVLKWKTLVGPGWSSFSVAGNRLFTQEQRGEDEAVVCLSADSGEPLWSHVYPGRFWEAIGGAGPRGTPTIGNNRLFTMGADGQVTAFRPTTGEVLWKRQLREDAGREPPQWGWSASPLVVGETVLVHAGGKEDKGLLAYSVESGELVWGAPSGDHSYSSPQLATFAGVDGVLMMTNAGLQFLNTSDGSIIWDYQWKVENYRAIQPLVVGNEILIATSLGIGTRKISVRKTEQDWELTEGWNSLNMKPEYNDYVFFNGHIYGFDGNILASIDMAEGKRDWKRGRYGNGQLLLLPDSAQLLVVSEKGELALVAAEPDEFRELGKVAAIEGKTWNHPVLIGNRVYLRNGQEAACFELPLADSADQQAVAAHQVEMGSRQLLNTLTTTTE